MRQRAVGFPGADYYRRGKSLDLAVPDLTQEQMDACLHCSMIPDWDDATVARIWLLAADAAAATLPPVVVTEAVELMMAGGSIMLLAQRLEPIMDVRDKLQQACDLFTVVLSRLAPNDPS